MRGSFRRRPMRGFSRRAFPGVFPPAIFPLPIPVPGMFSPGGRMPPIVEEAQQELAQANRLLAEGKPLEAAEIFARISDLAGQKGEFIRASHLAERASQSFLQGSDLEHTLVQARRAVRLSLQGGDLPHAVRLAHRILGELQDRGYNKESQALRAEFDAQLAQFGISLAGSPAASTAHTAKLPTQCPACLGPVRPDEVHWLDESSAQCPFCGTILRVE